jgi:ankyrin repeat protein
VDTTTGSTALIKACKKGDVPTVRVLLERGADLDVSDKQGNTALMMAVYRNHYEIARLLIALGADPGRQNKSGNTARTFAQSAKMKEILDQALERMY